MGLRVCLALGTHCGPVPWRVVEGLLHPHGSAGVSWSFLEACTAILGGGIVKTEHTSHVSCVSCSICKVNVSCSYGVQVMLSYGPHMPYSSC